MILITPEELADLEAKARATRDESWSVDPTGFNEHYVVDEHGDFVARVPVGNERTEARAAYIAACDPPTALRLIAAIRALTARAEAAEKERDELREKTGALT